MINNIAALRALLEEAKPFVGWDGPAHSIHKLVDVLSAVLDELERRPDAALREALEGWVARAEKSMGEAKMSEQNCDGTWELGSACGVCRKCLQAQIERLRAPPTEEEVERAAEAMWRALPSSRAAKRLPDEYRDQCRAALGALMAERRT